MSNWIENMFRTRVSTSNIIFTVLTLAFAWNVVFMPLYALTHPKLGEKLIEKIVENAQTSLGGIIFYLLGRLTQPKQEIKDEK